MDQNNAKFPDNTRANEVCTSGNRDVMHRFLRKGTALVLQDIENHLPSSNQPTNLSVNLLANPPANSDNDEPER